jgi:Transcription initiation factor IID, 18kD subunit
MMYGFGETQHPRDDTLDLMETYVYEFINNLVHRSLDRSQRSGFTQIQMRDLLKVIEADEKKYLRVPYIITGIEMTKKTS